MTARGPQASARRSPARRTSAIARAKTEKVAAVTKGLAPFHSRRSSADHSIIPPSTSSAPIGTRQSSTSAQRRQREAAARLLDRRDGIVVDSMPAKTKDGRGEERREDELLAEEADAVLGEGAADQRADARCRSSRRRGTGS